MDIIKNPKKEDKNSLGTDSYASQGIYFFDNPKKEKIPKKKRFPILSAFAAFLLLILIVGGYFFTKAYSVSKTVSISRNSRSFLQELGSVVSSVVSKDKVVLRGEESGRINILLLGAAGENNPGKNLTDTVMIMSIDIKNKKIGLLSLPRDLYVDIPGTGYSTKINSLYQYGLDNDQGENLIRSSVSEITGIGIDYFLIIDFDGFRKIIDDIGGINVMVERDIFDPRYPGPNYSYETFELKKGSRNLDGATALKYVRERHNDPEGDFGRAKRQQQVIQAVKNKIFSAKTLLNIFAINNLLNTLGNSVKTDIQLDEIESFIALSKELDTENISNAVVDAWKKESLLKVSHVATRSGMAFILVPRVGNYSEIKDLAKNLFDLDAIRRRQAEIEKEGAEIIILNRSGDNALPGKIKDLLKEKLGMKNVSVGYGESGTIGESTKVYTPSESDKIFTLDELLKKLPARLGQETEKDAILGNNPEKDIVIVLGKDLAKAHSIEEDSFENWKDSQDSQEYFQPIENR